MKFRPKLAWAILLMVSALLASRAHAQGVIIPGMGATSRAMAGASTAVGLDAASATYWNPAAISTLSRNDVYVGVETFYLDTHVSSRVPAGSIVPSGAPGGPIPAIDLAGSTFSETGLSATTSFAVVYHHEELPVSAGMAVYSLVGGAVNLPASTSNPLLMPPPLGFGPVFTSSNVLQFAPMLSVDITEDVSVGVGGMVNTMILALDPGFFATPNANGQFPSASHERPAWGGAFQFGLVYRVNDYWNVGASYKSEQWFEKYQFNSTDANGLPRDLTLDISLPPITSLGVAFLPWEGTTLAVDMRYIDYGAAAQFGTPLSQRGQGWQGVFAVALGAQHTLNERWKLQGGYLYNENPIPDAAAAFNVQSPAIFQHSLSLGATMQLTQSISTSLAVIHSFPNSILGPAPLPAPPGTTVGLDFDLTVLTAGLNIAY